jgi:hypothetical protein
MFTKVPVGVKPKAKAAGAAAPVPSYVPQAPAVKAPAERAISFPAERERLAVMERAERDAAYEAGRAAYEIFQSHAGGGAAWERLSLSCQETWACYALRQMTSAEEEAKSRTSE